MEVIERFLEVSLAEIKRILSPEFQKVVCRELRSAKTRESIEYPSEVNARPSHPADHA